MTEQLKEKFQEAIKAPKPDNAESQSIVVAMIALYHYLEARLNEVEHKANLTAGLVDKLYHKPEERVGNTFNAIDDFAKWWGPVK